MEFLNLRPLEGEINKILRKSRINVSKSVDMSTSPTVQINVRTGNLTSPLEMEMSEASRRGPCEPSSAHVSVPYDVKDEELERSLDHHDEVSSRSKIHVILLM